MPFVYIVRHGTLLPDKRDLGFKSCIVLISLSEAVNFHLRANGLEKATVITAPEVETTKTAELFAETILGTAQDTATEPCLGNDGKDDEIAQLAERLVASQIPALIVTHRRRIRALIRSLRTAANGLPLKFVGKKRANRTRAIMLNTDTMEAIVVSSEPNSV
jgi:hypothetical protein